MEDGEAQQQAENPLEEAGNSRSTAEAPDQADAENLNAGMDDGEAISDSVQVAGDGSVDAENNGSADQDVSEEGLEKVGGNPVAGTDDVNADEANNNIADQIVSGKGTGNVEEGLNAVDTEAADGAASSDAVSMNEEEQIAGSSDDVDAVSGTNAHAAENDLSDGTAETADSVNSDAETGAESGDGSEENTDAADAESWIAEETAEQEFTVLVNGEATEQVRVELDTENAQALQDLVLGYLQAERGTISDETTEETNEVTEAKIWRVLNVSSEEALDGHAEITVTVNEAFAGVIPDNADLISVNYRMFRVNAENGEVFPADDFTVDDDAETVQAFTLGTDEAGTYVFLCTVSYAYREYQAEIELDLSDFMVVPEELPGDSGISVITESAPENLPDQGTVMRRQTMSKQLKKMSAAPTTENAGIAIDMQKLMEQLEAQGIDTESEFAGIRMSMSADEGADMDFSGMSQESSDGNVSFDGQSLKIMDNGTVVLKGKHITVTVRIVGFHKAGEISTYEYAFGETRSLYMSEIFASVGMPENFVPARFNFTLSDDSLVSLTWEENDCLVTANDFFEEVALNIERGWYRAVILLRNIKPAEEEKAEIWSEDGMVSVTLKDAIDLPEGTKPAVVPSEGVDIQELLTADFGENADVQVKWFDISLGDVHDVSATVTLPGVIELPENPENRVMHVEARIYHVREEGIHTLNAAVNGSDITFETDGFSQFGIAWVVTFENTQTGETYTLTLPAAEDITLAEVLKGIGITGDAAAEVEGEAQSESESAAGFEKRIKNVESTNAETVLVSKSEESWTIRILKDGDALIAVTMDDDTVIVIDVDAQGVTEKASADENVLIRTVNDLYLPENASVRADVMDESSAENAIEAVKAENGIYENSEDTEETGTTVYTVFDIALENVDIDAYNGFQVQVRFPEDVSGRDFRLYHIHDGVTEEVALDTISGNVVANGQETVAGFTFETKNFSEFVLRYTVDFTYEGRTWSFPGQGSYRLTDVLAALGIERRIDDAALTLIRGEDHAGALFLTQSDGEYYINSEIAFADTYELRVRIGEKIYIITVTDTQESTNLSDFLKNAVITGATQDSDGKYHVEKDEEYSIILTFAEDSSYQFADNQTLTYQMPEGITILSQQEGDANTNIVYKGRTYQVGYHYILNTDGTLVIRYDTSDPDFPKLQDSTNVSFRFTYNGQFGGEITKIQFSDSIEREIIFDEPEPAQAYVAKNGTFDEATGTYHYTVKVTASGAVTDVRVKDVISGNALSFNNDVQVSGNSSEYTNNGVGNGFDYTFASMQEGEEITITYSANLDPSKIPANGKVTADMTRNTVIVTSDDGPPHNSSYSHEINLKKPDKNTGVESGTTTDGKKLYKWTIDYNTLALAKADGDTVSDSIGESSRQYMKYYGDVSVKVYDHSGSLVDTRSFTPATDYTWTYIVPDSDTTPYRYVFEYETAVDQAAVDLTGSSVKLDNDSEGPGGKDSEGITIGPKESTSITKEVVSSNEQEVTWISHIHVPASGLSRAVVTDTLPSIWSGNLGLSGNYMLYDLYKAGSLEITGLDDQEAYTVDVASSDKIVITFFKDSAKTQEGLNSSAGGRDITVKLTTTIDQDWLNAGYSYPKTYQSSHTNKININGGEDVQAEVKYIEPSIEKSGLQTGKGVYKYTIYVTHVDSSPIVVNDIFDTSLLEVDTSLDGRDWNKQSMYITGGDYPGHVYSGDTSVKVDYSDTTEGIQITANNVPLQSNGQFYPTYMITYFLKLKEGVDLEQLAIANGGKHDLTNTAMWNGHEGPFTFTTTYDFLDKQLLNGGQLGETSRKAQYQITFNPAKATLHEGEPMVMTDVMSANLSVDYGSIQIETDPAGQEVPYSLSGGKDEHGVSNGTTVATYTVPDSTRVVITYDADVRGNGSQTIVNTVSVNDEDETVTTTKSYGTLSEGQGAVSSFKIVKVDGYDANKKLEGVKFRIFAENEGIDFGEKAGHVKELVLETDENGEIVLDGDQYEIFFDECYHVQEVAPLPDYGTIGFDYLVTLTNKMEQVDYNHYVYYYSDSMQIKNWPLEGLVVEKKVESPDNSDKEQYYPFRISILKDDGTVDTSYNEKNGDDQFVNGVVTFELKDKEQKMFWGFQKGTRYKVEEIDSKGLAVSVTYSVFDEEGTVTEIKTDTDTKHNGTLTQKDEVIVFTNAKTEEKGALKLTKLVTVNGVSTSGTAADGEYTFTITGPGDATTVIHTVIIQVKNGVATKYKIDNATEFTNLPADRFVVVRDLAEGDYTITEIIPTNGASLASILRGDQSSSSGENDQQNSNEGGQGNDAAQNPVDLDNRKVTVHVTAGDTTAAQGSAQATFTNNIDEGYLKVHKQVTYNGSAPTTAAQKQSLAGTYTFKIYKDENCTQAVMDGETEKTLTVTIGNDGIAKDSETIQLTAGTYWLKEIIGDDSYVLPVGQNPQRIEITAENTTTAPKTVNVTNDYEFNEEDDNIAVDIVKKFTGLSSSDKIPEGFKVVLSFNNGTSNVSVDLGNRSYVTASGIQVKVEKSSDGLTWTWHVYNIPKSSSGFSIHEENYEKTGYDVAVYVDGALVQAPDTEQTLNVTAPTASLTAVTDKRITSENDLRTYYVGSDYVLLVSINPTGTLVISDKSLNFLTRSAIENAVKEGNVQGSFSEPVKFFSTEQHPATIRIDSKRTITVSTDSNGKQTVYLAPNTNSQASGFYVTYNNDPVYNNGEIQNDYTSEGVDLDIIKIRQGSNPVQYLDGATFSLRQIADMAATEGGTYQDAENAIKKTGTTADGGKLTFSGLVHGYYELTETIAPTGYVLTGDMTVYFKVDDNGVTWLTKGSGAPSTWDACTSTSSSLVTFKNASEATADDPETPEVESVAATNAAFTIRNTLGSALPQTGGPGTNLIYLIGLTFTAFAGVGLVMKKRRRNAA